MANKKCKKCDHYSAEPDKQDGVTERYCDIFGEQVSPNDGCPLWKKKEKKDGYCDKNDSYVQSEH